MENPVSRHLFCAALSLALFGCGGNPPETAGQATPAPEPAKVADNAPAAVDDSADANGAVAAHPGEQTYQKTCALCHGSPAMGAPVLGNTEDWAPRIAQGKDTLYLHATEGYVGEKGAMPAHGGNPSLDDETIRNAVDYMVAKAQ